MLEQLQALHSEHTFLHALHQQPANTTPTKPSVMTPHGSLNGIPRDDDFGDDRAGNGDPDDPNNEGPDYPIENPNNSDYGDDNPDDSEHGIQNNLADAITMLASNVQHQGGDSCLKVRNPDPFNGMDLAKLCMFLIQLQLSFNDQPRAFTEDQQKVNFTISYLKDIALTHFENSHVELDLLHPCYKQWT